MKLDFLPQQFWVVGTDTGIGKTLVSTLLLKHLGYDYWKPIQSGLFEETDRQFAQRLSGLPESHFFEETYRLTEPLSPHASARLDGIRIDLKEFIVPTPRHQGLIIEGAGGLLVPLNEKDLLLDLIAQTGLPALLVGKSGLGTINHCLLSLQVLRERGVEILGVVLNGPLNPCNKEAIEHFGHVQVLLELEPQATLSPEILAQLAHNLTQS